MANNSYVHLGPKIREVMSFGSEERIKWLFKERWIGYSKANEIISSLDHLFNLPRKDRLPGMLLVGETNNGKSMLIRKFADKHNDSFDPEIEIAQIPVLIVQAPSAASEVALHERILETLFVPYRKSGGASEKFFQVVTVLKQSTIRMLVIEEFSNLTVGTVKQQRQVLNAIKNLSNELKINIIGVGTHEARNAIRSDPQLTNRLPPTELPRWQLNREFLRLLASFEQTLPLKHPSSLSSKAIAPQLLAMSEGYIGELSYLLELATESAIRTGEEMISLSLLQKIRWIKPSKR